MVNEPKVVKLHRTSPDLLVRELQMEDFVELYAVGVTEDDKKERTICWYSSGNKGLLMAVGALEYLKNKLMEADKRC